MDIRSGDAFLIVDLQRDFCPGGALPVRDGHLLVPILNHWAQAFADARCPIFASRDWHPPHHVSFRERGGPWPPHCIQHSAGAAFHPDLALPEGTTLINKGMDPDRDAYSAFDGTDLALRLRNLGIRRLTVGGLALDYCVRASVLDAVREAFTVRLLRKASLAVEVHPGDGDQALAEMVAAGTEIIEEATP
ncbi:MAG: isochorismatase family protein [Acidithiobacillus sp.]